MQYPQLIKNRLLHYKALTLEDEENACKEILQEIALYALATTDFFSKAAFQGGTSLRILYSLPRFSEDLDFILKAPDRSFKWEAYSNSICNACSLFGVIPEVVDRTDVDVAVKKLFLKDNSIAKIFKLQFAHNPRKKLLIKFEIDTNPPHGSDYETQYLDFPLDYAILTQDLPSNFAGKCHALLCRNYVKGRDWFDLVWYIGRKVPVNLNFLSSAINQHGVWSGQNIAVTSEWLVSKLTEKIASINWQQARMDVERFVNTPYKSSLLLWNKEFFTDKVNKLLVTRIRDKE